MTLHENIQTKNGTLVAPQGDLFAGGVSVYDRFKKFIEAYPYVYTLFEKFAFELINRGHKKIGSKQIVERIRWFYATESMDDAGFKINNNYTCYLSRMFMQKHPQHKDIFETRIIKKA